MHMNEERSLLNSQQQLRRNNLQQAGAPEFYRVRGKSRPHCCWYGWPTGIEKLNSGASSRFREAKYPISNSESFC